MRRLTEDILHATGAALTGVLFAGLMWVLLVLAGY